MRISDWSSDVCSSDLEKLGLNVHLSTAPLHMFVRYTNPQNQRDLSIEPTSGGYPTRDVWYRENLPMSDMAVEQGLYLKTLTKRESIAHMATTVMEYLMVKGRYQEAIAVGYAIRSEEHTSELQSLMRISY